MSEYHEFEKQYMTDFIRSQSPKLQGKAGAQITRAEVGQLDTPEITDMLDSLGFVGKSYLDMGAATTKGMVQGYIGLPGDIEGLIYTIANRLGADVSEETLAPTTEEVKKFLDQYVGKVNDGNNPYETLGEFAAPGGYIPPAKAAARGLRRGGRRIRQTVDDNKELLRPVGSIRMGGGKNELALQQRDGFFSQAEKIMIDKAPNKGSSQQFMKLLERNVKPEEMQRLDMQSFLSSKDTFTKQEIVDYIRENSPQLERNVLISPNENPEQPQVPDYEFEDAVNEIDEFIQFDRIDFDRPLFSEVVGAETDNYMQLLYDELLQVEDELIDAIDEMPNAPESGTVNHQIELIKKQLEYLKKNYGYSVRIDVHDSIIPAPDVNMTDDGVVARSIAKFLKDSYGSIQNASVRNNSYVDADYIIESEDIEQAINNELVEDVNKFDRILTEYIENLAYAKSIDEVLNRGEDSGALSYTFMSRNNEYELDVDTTRSPEQGRYSIGYRGQMSGGGNNVDETMMLMRETEFHQNRRNQGQNIDPETANIRSFKKYTFGNEMMGETKMLPDNYTVYGFKFTDPELQSAVETRSGHFKGGELMHMRTTDRVAEEFPNDKSLFIEEIQSDYHKAGRGKKGIYRSQKAKEDAKVEEFRNDLKPLYQTAAKYQPETSKNFVYDDLTGKSKVPTTSEELENARLDMLEAINTFVNKKPLYAKKWNEYKSERLQTTNVAGEKKERNINDLSFEELEITLNQFKKRMMEVLNTAKRKADQVIEDVPFKEEMEMGVKQALQVGIDKNYDRVIFSKHDAVKVYTGSAPVDRYRELQNFVKKYAKEYNGKVETVTVKAGEYEEEFLSIPLTDEFKKAVKDKGQPLYEGATPAVAVGAAAVGMSEDNNGRE